MKFWIARNKGKWGGLNLFLSKPTKKLDGTFQMSVCNPDFNFELCYWNYEEK